MECLSSTSLYGTLTLPPSKSHTLRALLFASLARGESFIRLPLESPDTEAMMAACHALGASCLRKDGGIAVIGSPRTTLREHIIDAKNSGIVLRFVAAVAAHFSEQVLFTGDESITTRRPCESLLEGLRSLGAFAESYNDNGYAPFIVRGPIKPGHICIDGTDSQPVSALLIATSLLPGTSQIAVTNVGEKPWLQMTVDWLRRLGVVVEHDGDMTLFTVKGREYIEPFEYTVPGDLSSLAFPLVAALVCKSDLVIEGVDLDDVQGDKVLIDILQSMGAHFDIDREKKSMRIIGPQKLMGRTIDVNTCIDALPILAVVGCLAEGTTHLTNGAIARKKESDRIAAMTQELRKMGANVIEQADGFIIKETPLRGAPVNSHKDHRVALALAVAGLAADGTTSLQDVSCIAKTYPHFFSELRRLSR